MICEIRWHQKFLPTNIYLPRSRDEDKKGGGSGSGSKKGIQLWQAKQADSE